MVNEKNKYVSSKLWIMSQTEVNGTTTSRFAYVSKESDKTFLGGASTQKYGIAICFSM